MVPIDQAGSNFSFICKKFYISKILNEIGLNGTLSPTYGFSSMKYGFSSIFHEIQNFYDKSYFYFSFKQFWATENSKPILAKIENINFKANAIKLFRDLLFPRFILNYLILI